MRPIAVIAALLSFTFNSQALTSDIPTYTETIDVIAPLLPIETGMIITTPFLRGPTDVGTTGGGGGGGGGGTGGTPTTPTPPDPQDCSCNGLGPVTSENNILKDPTVQSGVGSAAEKGVEKLWSATVTNAARVGGYSVGAADFLGYIHSGGITGLVTDLMIDASRYGIQDAFVGATIRLSSTLVIQGAVRAGKITAATATKLAGIPLATVGFVFSQSFTDKYTFTTMANSDICPPECFHAPYTRKVSQLESPTEFIAKLIYKKASGCMMTALFAPQRAHAADEETLEFPFGSVQVSWEMPDTRNIAQESQPAQTQPAYTLNYADALVFNCDFYLNKHFDLRAAFGTNCSAATQHWLTYGIIEGRQAIATFSSVEYLSLNPDVAQYHGAKNYLGAVTHYLTYGRYENRATALPACYITQAACPNYPWMVGNFEDAWGEANAGARTSSQACFQRARDYYNWCGGVARMTFNTTTATFYSAGTAQSLKVGNPACASYPMPFTSFSDSKVFNCQYYLGYPDLKNAFGSNCELALNHWLTWGIREGRVASPSFSPSAYLNRYSDLVAAFGSTNYSAAIQHFLTHGLCEGRNGSL